MNSDRTPSLAPGSVVFAGDLAVAGDVTVSDDVTVNGVDISEVPEMVSGDRRVLYFSRSVLLNGDWSVAGSAVIQSINGYTLDRLDEVFWSKDKEQVRKDGGALLTQRSASPVLTDGGWMVLLL